MKIESITIENIRSYGKETVDFDDGLMLIHGDNGSGKSSLLGSIFGGLYLSNVLDYIDTDLTLDSLVRRTENSGKISLTFSVGDDNYTVDWVISVSEKEDGERRGSTTSCTLTGDSINEPVEGVKAVDSAVQEIIGLGPESFVNSVYVQQGDITRMVDANDEKRKEIIDGLLGLSKLDDYIERMHEARREIGSQVRKFGDLLEEKERQLNSYDDKSTLESNLSESKSKKKIKIQDKEKVEDSISKKEKEKSNIEDELESYEKLSNKLSEARSEYNELKQKQEDWQQKQKNAEQEKDAISIERDALLNSIEEKCDELDIDADEDIIQNKLESVREKYNSLNTEISSLQTGELKTIENTINQHKESIETLEKQKSNKISEKQSLENLIKDIQNEKQESEEKLEEINTDIENYEEKLDDICDNIDLPKNASAKELRDTHIPEGRENLLERSKDVYISVGETQSEWKMYQELVDSNVCTICDTEHNIVSEDIKEHLDEITSERNDMKEKSDAMSKQQDLFDSANQYIDSIIDLNSERKRIEDTVSQIEQRLEDKQNQLSQIKTDIEETKLSIQEEKDGIVKNNTKKDRVNNKIKNKQDKLDEYKSDVDELKDIKDMFSSVDELNQEINNLRSKIEQNKALKKETRNQRLDAEQKKNELEKEINEHKDKQKLEKEINEHKDKLDELDNLKTKKENELDDIRDELAEIKQILKQIKSIEDRCRELEEKKVDAANKEVESESVIATYKNVKTQLRQENIGLLNKYANEVFKSVYHSQVYQRLDIDENYSINLITGDGVKIKPQELSGGEETIVSLAIRAGVYRLLVERNGNADKLPPFILDEPTTFLDTNHVSNLQGVIDTIKSWDVPQVIVVSHKNDMIENADVSYEISKNPVTETSNVSMTKL